VGAPVRTLSLSGFLPGACRTRRQVSVGVDAWLRRDAKRYTCDDRADNASSCQQPIHTHPSASLLRFMETSPPPPVDPADTSGHKPPPYDGGFSDEVRERERAAEVPRSHSTRGLCGVVRALIWELHWPPQISLFPQPQPTADREWADVAS
jgi:hypothetical protein